MSFIKSKGFKYLKNFIIGVGAAVVMVGALFKIMSWEGADQMLIAGLLTEAFLFLLLGILPPEKDYYWEKLYPGLSDYNSNMAPAIAGGGSADSRALDAGVVEGKLGGMLDELQSMSKSLGSLKALQEVDFSETGEQLKTMNSFYTRMNEAMSSLNDTVEDAAMYKENMTALNRNLNSLNSVYGNVLNAFSVKQ